MTDCQPAQPAAATTEPQPSLWGKYRGTVLDNVDLEGLGKLLVEVPTVPMMLMNWATPCVPYAGLQQGLWGIPPIGANVWIEFEGGDPSYPIWTGCFWEPLEAPLVEELSPEEPALLTVLRSKLCTMAMNDTPVDGGILLNVVDPAVQVPVTLTMTSLGLEINVGGVNLLMNPETGVTIEAFETTVVLSEAGVAVEAPAVTVNAAEIEMTGDVSIIGDVKVAGAVTVIGDTDMTGAVQVAGPVGIVGAVEAGPAVNVTGSLTVQGPTDIVGAFGVEGATNIAGLFGVEGDVNILGAGQVEGNFAVAGLIEGVVVPPLL